MRRSVYMRAELHPFLADLPQIRKAEHLVAAAVGENRPVPADEPMKPARQIDHLRARPEIEMIRVTEDRGGSELNQFARRDRFDASLCSYRHEAGGFDLAVGSCDRSRAGTVIPTFDAKFHLCKKLQISGSKSKAGLSRAASQFHQTCHPEGA